MGIVFDRGRADVALKITTGGTVHLVAAKLLDKGLATLAALPHQCCSHGFFNFMLAIELVVLSVLLTGLGNVRGRLAATTADLFAVRIRASKLEVFFDRR